MDGNIFASKALEVNLLETNREAVELSDEEKWFIGLSQDYLGIHERTQTFFKELHHPYPDFQWIVNNLVKISVEDFWFYRELEEAEEAFELLLSAFEVLFSRISNEALLRNLFQTLLQFLKALMGEERFRSSACRTLGIIRSLLKEKPVTVMAGANLFRHISYPRHQDKGKENGTAEEMRGILAQIVERGIEYWRQSAKSGEWISDRPRVFKDVRIRQIEEDIGELYFAGLREKLAAAETWDELCALPLYKDIAERLREYTAGFQTPLEQIYFLYYLLQLNGMGHLKDHLLWDINRLLRTALHSLTEDKHARFLESVFTIFEEFKAEHISTVLDCIETLGTEIVSTEQTELINIFTDRLIAFGFIYPGEIRIKQDWQVESNPDHLKNIRVWLAIIEKHPTRMKKLLAALIVHLRIGGVFIQDTDLFQKDMSRLLNTDIKGIYKLIKHLAILFPIYYNEIGAEGELREMTTRVDEISGRRDRIIHFLRKQVHAESNNTHVELIREIISYWQSADPARLLPYLPQDVIKTIDTEGPYFQPVHEVMQQLMSMSASDYEALLSLPAAELDGYVSRLEAGSDDDRQRVRILFRLAALLREKYSIDSHDIVAMVRKNNLIDLKLVRQLEKQLNTGSRSAALETIFRIMEILKGIILDPEYSESWENIYYKRHIAAGIPSMYGQYHEKKYEALGLTLRLEKTAERLINEIIDGMNFNFITFKSLKHIADILEYFKTGLRIRGIYNQGFESNINILEYSLASESFSLDQYINIFQFLIRNIREIIEQYFISIYDQPLKKILRKKYRGQIPEDDLQKKIAQESEAFYRDTLASSFFIQTLDTFLGDILRNLRETRDAIPGHLLHKVMSYDPELLVNPIYHSKKITDNKVFLGAKAYFLKKLTALDFPIPEGFVLTTEFFRHKDVILRHPHMEQDVDDIINAELGKIESITGQKFGSAENPLLLSVRSGSAFSMPGAMQTFLNVGINREIARNLSRRRSFAWAAWDCYRRLLQSWGMAFGIQRDEFDWIMKKTKATYDVTKKRFFSPEQMRELADSYRQLLDDRQIDFVEEPFQQLKTAIWAVLDSWSSDRARLYRKHLQVADDWGTAVLIQRMIFGNLNLQSGTGVVFTKNPTGDNRINLYGDYIPCSQGEDVVSGLVHTLPISAETSHSQQHDESDLKALKEQFPKIYEQLETYAVRLIENHDFPHQEIEFTFESPEKLYILQTRPQVVRKQKAIEVFDTAKTDQAPAGRGIGIGGGVLNGVAAFDLEDIKRLRSEKPESNCILLRPDTVPDDIEMVFACDGLLTARGGTTSHAAVTAVQLGTVCVVNCRDLDVDEHDKTAVLNGVHFTTGDEIAIDGINGGIYKGNLPVCTRTEDLIS